MIYPLYGGVGAFYGGVSIIIWHQVTHYQLAVIKIKGANKSNYNVDKNYITYNNYITFVIKY